MKRDIRPKPWPEAEDVLENVGWVHGLARGLVRDTSLAQDLAQDTLAAALESSPLQSSPLQSTGAGSGGLRAWLATVLRRRVVSERRSAGRRATRERQVARNEAVPTAESVLERAELQGALVQEVLALREPYRGILLLRYFEGLTPAEIASSRGSSAATVRSQIKRALGILRDRLGHRWGDQGQWLPGLVAFVFHPPGTLTRTLTATGVSSGSAAGLLAGLTTGGAIMSIKTVCLSLVIGTVLIGGALYMFGRGDGLPGNSDSSKGDMAGRGDSKPSLAKVAPEGGVAPPSVESARTRMPTIDSTLGTIAGQIFDEVGAPLEGIVVHAVKTPTTADPDTQQVMVVNGFRLVQPVDVPELGDSRWRAETDAGGRFSIANLESGSYAIIARGAGYRLGTLRDIDVEAARTATAELRLAPGLSITGIVFDPEGIPVPGSRVSAGPGGIVEVGGGALSLMIEGDESAGAFGSNWSSGDSAPEAICDENGRFVLDGLKSGNYHLTARHDDWANGRSGTAAAGSRDVQISLRVGATIHGLVLSPDGKPMAGVSVDRMDHQASAMSRPDGSFTMEKVSPGSVRLQAQSDGLPAAYAERFRVADEEVVQEITLQFEPAAIFTGVVLRPGGDPLPGAHVRVVRDNRRWGASDTLATRTDDEGRYRIAGLRVDKTYRVTASHERYLEDTLLDIISEAGEQVLPELHVHQGGTISGRVFVSESGEPIAGARLRVQVAGRSEATGPQVRVTLAQPGAERGSRNIERGEFGPASRSVVAESDAEGRFSLSPLEPGEYIVSVNADGFAPFRSADLRIAADSTVADLNCGLVPGVEISGVAIDGSGRTLIAVDVTAVSVDPPGIRAAGKTDAEGRFRIPGLAPGPYSVSARAAGLVSSSVESNAGGASVELVLLEHGSVQGIVVDMATGRPVEEFSVKLTRQLTEVSDQFLLPDFGSGNKFQSPDGVFLLTDLAPGQYDLKVRAEGYVRYEQKGVRIDSGQATDLPVALDIGGAIDGYVRDREGKPIVGAKVSRVEASGDEQVRGMLVMVSIELDLGDDSPMVVHSLGGPRRRETETDENGYFVLSGLPVGDVDIEVTHGDYIDQVKKEVEITRRQTRRLDAFELLQGATIAGIVRKSDGTGAVGHVVIRNLDDDSAGRELVGLDGDGRFEKKGFKPGRYMVKAYHLAPPTPDGEVVMPEDQTTVSEEVTLIEGRTKNLDLRLP